MKPNCQQCRVNPGLHKVLTSKGNAFRWKCESCFKRTGTSGFPRMESSDVSSIMMAQVADRFAAYPSEGKDAASFRLVKEELGKAYDELLRTPQGDPRHKQITAKHPGLATAVSMIAVVDKNLRAENMTLRRIEDESYIALRSGDIEKSKKLQAQAVQFENKLKETQKTLYAKANKVFIQAGFQDLVLSTD